MSTSFGHSCGGDNEWCARGSFTAELPPPHSPGFIEVAHRVSVAAGSLGPDVTVPTEADGSIGRLQQASPVTVMGASHEEGLFPRLQPLPPRYCDAQVKQLDERQRVKLAICESLAWLFHLVLPTFVLVTATAG